MVSIMGLIKNRDFNIWKWKPNQQSWFQKSWRTDKLSISTCRCNVYILLIWMYSKSYNIRNMHASTAPPNNMRINSNDEGDSPLVIRIWRLSPIPIMIVRCVHLHYHGTMKACQEKPIALILQRKQYISSEIPVFKYEWFYFSSM